MPTSWLTVELLSDGQLKAGAVGVGVDVGDVVEAVTVAVAVITASVWTEVTVVVSFWKAFTVTTCGDVSCRYHEFTSRIGLTFAELVCVAVTVEPAYVWQSQALEKEADICGVSITVTFSASFCLRKPWKISSTSRASRFDIGAGVIVTVEAVVTTVVWTTSFSVTVVVE